VFKDNVKAYWRLLIGLLPIVRTIVFEKFTFVFFFFYLIVVLSLAFILSVLHWGVAVMIVLLGVVLFVKTLERFEFLKRSLIRKGDRIEYADPKESETKEMFKTAEVLLKISLNEAKKTGLISQELIEGNRHFYLVQKEKMPTVIAFDWIIGLSPEVLEIEFDG